LHDASGAVIHANDNWTAADAAQIAGTGLPPASNLEAAIVATLPPGAYTAIVRGSDGGEGIALVELYDLDQTSHSSLVNISTRGRVAVGDDVLIGGFITDGAKASTVVVRALGASLTGLGVIGSLGDPSLSLHDSFGVMMASNDQWREGDGARVIGYGLGRLQDSEAALVATVPAGRYTAIVRGAGTESGVALVEVYKVE